METELMIYSGGGDIKKLKNNNPKDLTEIEKKKIRLKERIRIFTKELERLEKLEKDNEKLNL